VIPRLFRRPGISQSHGWSGKTTTDMLRSHSLDLDFMHNHEHNEARRAGTDLGHKHGSRPPFVREAAGGDHIISGDQSSTLD